MAGERRGLLVHSAAELVTLAGPARARRGDEMGELARLRDGAVACLDGRVVTVGTTDEVRSRLDDDVAWEELDASGRCVTPGLIDPHTHLLFAGSREGELELRQRGAGYLEVLAAGGGILSTVEATRAASDDELLAGGRRWLTGMLANGVTTVEAKSGYGLEAETELRTLRLLLRLGELGPVEIVPTLLAAHAVPPEYRGRADAYLDEVAVPLGAEAARAGLARFVDAFCERGVFDAEQAGRVLAAGSAAGLTPRLHADELAPSGGARVAAELGAASADHLAAIDPTGLAALAAAEGATVATLLPMTTLYLGHPDAPARRLIEAGVPVALGTDFNPGTSPSPSLLLAMALGRLRLGLSAAEVLTAVTMNAAAALRLTARLGSLEPGKDADLVIWEVPTHEQLPYWIGAPLAHAVVKRGRPVAGAAHRGR